MQRTVKSTVLLSGSPISQLCIIKATAGGTVILIQSSTREPVKVRALRSWYPCALTAGSHQEAIIVQWFYSAMVLSG